MSIEVFLLFAIAVIYCVISFRDLQGETSVSGKREQSRLAERLGEGPVFQSRFKREKRWP